MVCFNRVSLGTLLSLFVLLAGCSWLPGQADYDEPAPGRALEIPPGLDEPGSDETMRVPGATYSQLTGGVVAANSGLGRSDTTELIWREEAQTLVVPEDADKVWQRVAFALDRIGLEIEDRQPESGMFRVSYVDLEARERRPGLFSRWVLRRKGPVDHSGTYQLRLTAEGSQTLIRLYRDEGALADESVAQEILSALRDRLI